MVKHYVPGIGEVYARLDIDWPAFPYYVSKEKKWRLHWMPIPSGYLR